MTPHLLPPHRALVDAEVEGMALADDGLAQQARADRDAVALGEGEQLPPQTEAVDFDAGVDDRLARLRNHGRRFRQRLRQRRRIALVAGRHPRVRVRRARLDTVARQLEVDRALRRPRQVQAAVDFAKGGVRVVQRDCGDRDLREHIELGRERSHPMMEQRIASPFIDAGGAADDDHRRLLRIGTGHRVDEAQATHAVGDTDRPDALDARIGVRRVARVELIGSADHTDGTVFEQPVEAEHEIARDTEDVGEAHRLQACDQVLADGRLARAAQRLAARRGLQGAHRCARGRRVGFVHGGVLLCWRVRPRRRGAPARACGAGPIRDGRRQAGPTAVPSCA